MDNDVTFKDCEWLVKKGEIRMKLPRLIDLSGIRHTRNHPTDHFRWNNQHGSFYIHCGRHASFDSFLPDVQEIQHLFWFESIYTFDSSVPYLNDRFRIWHYEQLLALLGESLTQKEIIQAVKSETPVQKYLSSFFDWLNEFRRRHGDEHHFYQSPHYYPLN